MTPEERRCIDRVRRAVGRAINRYRMIAAGDRVLLALSGGKDSLALADTLHARLRHLPISYELRAAHVRVRGITDSVDTDYLASFCGERGIALDIIDIALDPADDPDGSACFRCARARRTALFQLARDAGCPTIAFGHTMDDAVETLLMNMTFNARVSGMPGRLALFGGALALVRPLILLSDAQVARYASVAGLKPSGGNCPYGAAGAREAVRALIGDLGRLSPRARTNLFHATSNIDPEYLP